MTDLTRRKKELLNAYNNLCSCYGDIISEQTKTINQLKELLKRVNEHFEWIDRDEPFYINDELWEDIKKALGEK